MMCSSPRMVGHSWARSASISLNSIHHARALRQCVSCVLTGVNATPISLVDLAKPCAITDWRKDGFANATAHGRLIFLPKGGGVTETFFVWTSAITSAACNQTPLSPPASLRTCARHFYSLPASLRPHAKQAGSNPEKTNADDFFLNRKAIKNSPFEGRKNASKLPQNACGGSDLAPKSIGFANKSGFS